MKNIFFVLKSASLEYHLLARSSYKGPENKARGDLESREEPPTPPAGAAPSSAVTRKLPPGYCASATISVSIPLEMLFGAW